MSTHHETVISVRVSRALRDEIHRLARAAGLDASSWLRMIATREAGAAIREDMREHEEWIARRPDTSPPRIDLAVMGAEQTVERELSADEITRARRGEDQLLEVAPGVRVLLRGDPR